MKIGDRIKELRNKYNMSQSDLAAKLGYSNNTTISKIEREETEIKLSQIVAICEIFQISPNELIYGEEDKFIKSEQTTTKKEKYKVRENIVDKNDYLTSLTMTIIFMIIGLLAQSKIKDILLISMFSILILPVIHLYRYIRQLNNNFEISISIDSELVYRGKEKDIDKSIKKLSKASYILSGIHFINIILLVIFLNNKIDYLVITNYIIIIILSMSFIALPYNIKDVKNDINVRYRKNHTLKFTLIFFFLFLVIVALISMLLEYNNNLLYINILLAMISLIVSQWIIMIYNTKYLKSYELVVIDKYGSVINKLI